MLLDPRYFCFCYWLIKAFIKQFTVSIPVRLVAKVTLYEMDKTLCPSGEHCLRRERGDTCLMWHPPAKHTAAMKITEKATTEENGEQRAEEERQVQLALKMSLKEQKITCQFCKTEVESHDNLLIHQLKCEEMEKTGFSEEENEDPSQQKSLG